MNAFEWIALVGAAAWIPQVVGWVAGALARPRVRVIPSRAPEIGYTTYGPIFNLTCAISAARKDAVIERITALVTHERGQSTTFTWVTLNETFSQVRGPEGVTEVGKNQPAVALKVSTLVLTEKQIGMQEPAFDEGRNDRLAPLVELHNHLKKAHPADYAERTRASKEFADLVDFAKRNMPWQAGRYSVRLTLHLAGVKHPTEQTFGFVLTNPDIERLEQNKDEAERYFIELVAPPPGEAEPKYHWNWIYPPFEAVRLPARQ
jgi:hypothetical protein